GFSSLSSQRVLPAYLVAVFPSPLQERIFEILRDILRKVVAQNLNPNEVKAKDIMTGSCFTINSDADLEDASDLFNKRNIRRLPIVKEGKIVGIITTQEVAKNLKYALLKRRREYSDEIGGEHSLRR
ncbi:MAG: CBS domain-containing protein, partial [Candidatus Altiarchaeota archaeon]|nr:CBS domain-containing protein [Candidatus Altiarchaeota archaeon]